MIHIDLSRHELAEVEHLIEALTDSYRNADDPAFLAMVGDYAHRLPSRLRRYAAQFRDAELGGSCRISGFEIEDERIGSTPAHWSSSTALGGTIREDLYLILCASLLGEVFGWSSQQGGRMINEVVPVVRHENDQINSSSTTTLLWHTEDAFHPYRADYICLMCLRNSDRTATTVACIGDAVIPPSVAAVLFECRFVFRPDAAHLPSNGNLHAPDDPGSAALTARSFARIERLLRVPERNAILFGAPSEPYVRLDSDAVDRDRLDPIAAAALDAFIVEIDSRLREVVLEPGEILIVDNYRAVHGRQPFTARYDGRDRWLKRVNVTRDLRKSRDSRLSVTSRVIY